MRVLTLLCFIVVLLADTAMPRAETVKVPGRNPVDLQLFSCNEFRRSKLVKRVCYEGTYDYMLVLVGKKYLQYCTVDDEAIHKFLDAADKDRYYDRFIKKHFNCRGKKLPTYT